MPLKLAGKNKRETFNVYDLLIGQIPGLIATLLAEGLNEEYFFGVSVTRTGQLCISVSDSKRNTEKQYFSTVDELWNWLNEVTGGVGEDSSSDKTARKR